jgi:hypothetical protein
MRYVANQNQQQKVMDIDDFIAEIETQTVSLNQTYRSRIAGETFDVLVGIKTTNQGSVLEYIPENGVAEVVRKYWVIGHGDPYGSIFLKELWRPDMTMQEVAELGYFIIRYIERFQLDNTVGVGNERPQIFFLPDNAPADASTEEQAKYNLHPADSILLEKFEMNTTKNLEKFEMNLKRDFNLYSS